MGLKVRLVSADTPGALTAIQSSGVILYETEILDDLTVDFRIKRQDFRNVERIAKRRGDTLRIIKRYGAYWRLIGGIKRPFLVFGFLLLFTISTYIPTRVLFIRVEGNSTVPTRLILEEAAKCGIHFGASRRVVRSEKVKNALLDAMPQLKWAGVNTSGCVATITVRPRDRADPPKLSTGVSNIIAARDGYILSGTVTRGNPLFSVGQSVKAGDILVSGYTDCGLSIRATEAEGEIFARTNRELSVISAEEFAVRQENSRTVRKYALIIGKKRINLYKDSGILDSSCVKMTDIRQLTLPGGFGLPLYLVIETWTDYSVEESSLEPEEAKMIMIQFADDYITGQMAAGQILSKQEQFSDDFSLNAKFTCQEMIGQVQTEEIIKPNGERN